LGNNAKLHPFSGTSEQPRQDKDIGISIVTSEELPIETAGSVAVRD